VAQLVAQATCNRQVVGSSPTAGSEKTSSSPTFLKSRIGSRSYVPHLCHILRAVPRHGQPKARSGSSFGPCSACGRWISRSFQRGRRWTLESIAILEVSTLSELQQGSVSEKRSCTHSGHWFASLTPDRRLQSMAVVGREQLSGTVEEL